MTNTILVAFDGSANSKRAFQFAVTLADAIHGRILVLNVQPNYETMNTKRFISQAAIRDYTKEQAMEVLQNLEIPANVDVELKYRVGIPEMQICREAEEPNVFCIVMGSRGHGSIIDKIIGSVGTGVIKHATKPVTIVPAIDR